MDQHAYSHALSEKNRFRMACSDPDLKNFSGLSRFDDLVGAAVAGVYPGSLAGYYRYGKSEIVQKAKALLLEYKGRVDSRVNFWMTVIRCKRLAKRLRLRCCASYAPGGTMYTRVAKTTFVGK